VTPIDTATNTARPAIQVAPRGAGDYSAAITPDGKTLYIDGITGSGTKGFIVPVNTATGAVGKAIIVAGFPYPMAITPNGKTLYVLCAGGPGPQDVVPVNTATNTAGPAIHTGLQPQAIAITTGNQQQR
jgi:DNA-binding beta-propeller fold protein YncE